MAGVAVGGRVGSGVDERVDEAVSGRLIDGSEVGERRVDDEQRRNPDRGVGAAEVAQGRQRRDVDDGPGASHDGAVLEGLVGVVALFDAGGEVGGVDVRGLDVGVDLLQPGEEQFGPAADDLLAAYLVGGEGCVPGGRGLLAFRFGVVDDDLLFAEVVG
ncbi:hypothetical protein OG322_40250 [Streptomyces sp. NBC_01260]|uniref:hypothetical protein n=1 Tax=unclassified Streptomyces TaxID=2593676 RepID=UPI002E2F9BD3|nr:hypothetical protein [Streptomyces sp. NBC_01260]